MGARDSGVFVVVEGPEGAGKSTLARWLGVRLTAEGLPVVTVRQPGLGQRIFWPRIDSWS